eukprot:13083707-Alexandrium_andersonii.AAC.1
MSELDFQRREVPGVLSTTPADAGVGGRARPRADPLAQVRQPRPCPQAVYRLRGEWWARGSPRPSPAPG